MLKQLPATAIVCSVYQRLLEESAAAREAWSKRREEICWAQVVSKQAIDELLRLQAKYARAYTLLQNHAYHCERCRCRLVSRSA
jgi:hypothetical protein